MSPARRSVSTALPLRLIRGAPDGYTSTAYRVRLVQAWLDGASRPRSHSDSYEAPPTGMPRPRPVPYKARSIWHLDCAPTRTRLVRPLVKLQLARPRVKALDLLYSPTLRQKSEHSMRLPTTTYRHGYNSNQHGSNTGVRSHFLPPIPGWEVKTCHYAHHTAHYFATSHP
jgi:hypothetical protein